MDKKSHEDPAERLDEDNPEWTQSMLRKARPASEVLPGLIGAQAAAELLKPKGGRPPSSDPTVAVTLRLRQSDRQKYEDAAGDKWRKLAERTLHEHAPERAD